MENNFSTEKNDADQSSRQAQVLWSACQALLSAIKSGCPGLAWKDQLRPLEPEITAVKYAAGKTVLRNSSRKCFELKLMFIFIKLKGNFHNYHKSKGT